MVTVIKPPASVSQPPSKERTIYAILASLLNNRYKGLANIEQSLSRNLNDDPVRRTG